MRFLRMLALLSVVTFVVVPICSGGDGNGAVISKGTGAWIWWFSSANGNLAVFSPEQYFGAGFCDQPTGDWVFMDYHDVWRPWLPKDNYWIAGPHFTRFYPGIDPATYPGWEWNPTFLCQFLETAPAAEGISEVKWSESNFCNMGPGRSTWSERAHGTLYTPTTVCSSGMAKFDMVLKWMLTADAYVTPPPECVIDDPSHVRTVVENGPRLKCIGK